MNYENGKSFQYIALIRQEGDSAYWIDIPDIPGCAASGDTEDEAMFNMQEALELHLEGLAEEKIPLPVPRSKDDVLADQDNPYLKAYIIEVDHKS